jgi:hypothetical protein
MAGVSNNDRLDAQDPTRLRQRGGRFNDLSNLPSGSLTAAVALAGHIFDAIGVHTDWVWSNASASDGHFVRDDLCFAVVRLTVVPRLAEWPSDSSTHPMGVALSGNGSGGGIVGTVYVFLDQIDAFTFAIRRCLEVALGHVMVHEIGHLLLPARPDVNRGIMTPKWDPTVLPQALEGRLLFTSQQGALIRQTLKPYYQKTGSNGYAALR